MAITSKITFGDPPNSFFRMVSLVHRPEHWPESVPKKLRNWNNADAYTPPLPRAVPTQGYPCWLVDNDGFQFSFFSSVQIDHFLDVYTRKILPTSRQLGQQMNSGQVNQIWLSRVPKPKWEKRLKLADYISAKRDPFDDLIATLV